MDNRAVTREANSNDPQLGATTDQSIGSDFLYLPKPYARQQNDFRCLSLAIDARRGYDARKTFED